MNVCNVLTDLIDQHAQLIKMINATESRLGELKQPQQPELVALRDKFTSLRCEYEYAHKPTEKKLVHALFGDLGDAAEGVISDTAFSDGLYFLERFNCVENKLTDIIDKRCGLDAFADVVRCGQEALSHLRRQIESEERGLLRYAQQQLNADDCKHIDRTAGGTASVS